MSTILDALRRLEREQASRASEQLPNASLASLAASSRSPGSKLGRVGMVLACVAVAAIAGAAATWLFLGSVGPTADPIVEVSEFTEPEQIALAQPAAEPHRADADPRAATGAASDSLRSPAEPRRAARVADAAESSRGAGAAPLWENEVSPGSATRSSEFLAEVRVRDDVKGADAGPRVTHRVEALDASARRRPNDVGRSASEIEVAVVERDRNEPAQVAAAAPAPEIRAAPDADPASPRLSQIEKRHEVEPLPVIVRSSVPSVVVTRTTWHPIRGRRRAELEVLEDEELRSLQMREGQFLGPLELAEISPSGVTFLHNGVEIHRRVGGGSQH